LHNAGIFQDTDSTAISVIIFSLSKMFNRPRLSNNLSLLKFKEEILIDLLNAKNILQINNIEEYRKIIKKIFEKISKFESKFGMYITELLEYAKIKRGGRIYEHGFSIGATADLLGISSWELMSYLGETKLIDKGTPQFSIKQKISTLRRIFSL
jgi:hypothetical protein